MATQHAQRLALSEMRSSTTTTSSSSSSSTITVVAACHLRLADRQHRTQPSHASSM
jgi:hypothetical protein